MLRGIQPDSRPFLPTAALMPTELPVQWLNRRRGLPSGQVHAACQDRAGLLWIATPSGLVCWDGTRARVLTQADGLRTQGLRSLACRPDGRLWIGSDLGVDLLDPAAPGGPQITPLTPPDWPHGWVSHIVFDAQGGAWLGCARGLIRWTAQHGFVRCDLGDTLITALLLDASERLWVAGPQLGLRRQDGDTFRPLALDGAQRVGAVTCLALCPDRQVLVGGVGGLLMLNAQDAATDLWPERQAAPLSALLWTGQELWVGSNAGLSRYVQAADGWHGSPSLLPGVAVNALMHDTQGNLWISTDHAGLARISGLRGSMTAYVPGGSVLMVRPAPDGQVWLGGSRGSWALDLDSGGAQPLDGLQDLQVWDIQACGAQLWAATQQGLYWQQGGRFERFAPEHAALAQPCRAFLARPEGLWLATIHGLYLVNADPAAPPVELLGEGESLGYVYTLEQDAQGRALVGCLGRGLWRSEAGGLRPLVSGPLRAGGHVYALAPHPDGRLAALQDSRTLLLDASDRAGALLSGLDAEHGGVAGWSARWVGNELWVGGSSGLRQYGPEGTLRREIQAWIGPDAWEFTTSRSLLPLPDGRVLCGVNSGVVLLDPTTLGNLPPLPAVRLGRLHWSGAAPDTPGGRLLSIVAGNWGLEAELACPWFLDEQDLEFRHRLLGFERDWAGWTPLASVAYTSLPPGEYSLEVQVRSRLCGLGQPSRLFTLQVRPPALPTRLGQAWTSIISARTSRRLLAQNLLLEQAVRERTLEAEQANARLRVLNDELLALSSTDALTGIGNRRAFDATLRRELRRAQQGGTPLSVALLDIDAFKRYNDSLGHVQGDLCLQQVARILQGALRLDLDQVARYGGEEFVLVLPETTSEGAVRVVQRAQTALSAAKLPHPASEVAAYITLSGGVATTAPPQLLEAGALLRQADLALYQAKHAGRNCVRLFLVGADSDWTTGRQ
jgi:diguanylate cyclase (GGDEF)-like protein